MGEMTIFADDIVGIEKAILELSELICIGRRVASLRKQGRRREHLAIST
jgi:hypothetical protein